MQFISGQLEIDKSFRAQGEHCLKGELIYLEATGEYIKFAEKRIPP